jgi:hypothetical protein
MALSVFDFMEDFDNAELSDYERDEQLREAVKEYNEQFHGSYDPYRTLKQYKSQRWIRQHNDE